MNTTDTNNTQKTATPFLEETKPVRIIVQTKTHLVPGEGYFSRIRYMQNLICQHHWNRDFQPRDRWDVYGAKFGYGNQHCFFLLDHGETDDDSTVPILRYHWTGKYLIPIKGDIPKKMLEKLKNESLFTRPRSEKKIMDDATKCKSIQRNLRSERGLSDGQIKYLKEHPQQTEWLKNNIEPRFWRIVEKDERFASSSWTYQRL